MKTTITLKRTLLIGATILALGAGTAFAATNNSQQNNKNSNNCTNQRNMSQKSNVLQRDGKVPAIQSLAKILGEDPQTIQKNVHQDFSDIYQYAKKKGVLNKYKAERLLLAKEHVQKAVDNERFTKEEGAKALTRIQYNINNEKPEKMGIRSERGTKRHGEKGMHKQNSNHRMNQNNQRNCQN